MINAFHCSPRRAKRSIACSALLVLVASCGSDKVTAPAITPARLERSDLGDPMRIGLTVRLGARVVGSDSLPMSGVAVRWNVPAGGGTLDSATVSTDVRGYAVTTWKLPMQVEQVAVTAQVSGLPALVEQRNVLPEFPGSINVLEDTIRFSTPGSVRSIRVLRRDVYGNAVPPTSDYPAILVTATGATVAPAIAVGDTAVVQVTSTTLGRGVVTVVSQTSDGGLRDSVIALTAASAATIRAIAGGLDSLNGLVVGQNQTLLMTVIDSAGNVVPATSLKDVDLGPTGLRLTSSNPNVVSVSNNGVVTAIAPGTATVTAVAGSVSYAATIPVYAVFDLGTRQATLPLLVSDTYAGPLSQTLAGGSTLVDMSFVITRPSSSSDRNVLQARTATGGSLWSRAFGLYAATAYTDPSGSVYVVQSPHLLSALDGSGGSAWTYDFSRFDGPDGADVPDGAACAVATRSDAVVLGCGQAVFAVSKTGSLAWVDSIPEYAIHVVTTPTLTIVRTTNFVIGINASGTVQWTVPAPAYSFASVVYKANLANGAPNAMMTDASSRSYLVNRTIRALNADGTTGWDLASSQEYCVLALSGTMLACRNGGVVTGVDASNGTIMWTRAILTGVGGLVALSDGGLAIVGEYLYRLDARAGTVSGRSLLQLSATSAALTSSTLAVYFSGGAYMYTPPFKPGSDWAQIGGNAARSQQAISP